MRRLLRAIGRLGDAEVAHLDGAVVADEHVRRRDVAMDDAEALAAIVALLVRVVQRRADADADVAPRRRAGRVRCLCDGRAHDLAQVLAVHVLHREEVAVVDDADVVDLRDVRVLERRGEARLVEEQLRDLASSRRSSRMRLTTTIFSKPTMPVARARNSSAMPPDARWRSTVYLPNRSGSDDCAAISNSICPPLFRQSPVPAYWRLPRQTRRRPFGRWIYKKDMHIERIESQVFTPVCPGSRLSLSLNGKRNAC